MVADYTDEELARGAQALAGCDYYLDDEVLARAVLDAVVPSIVERIREDNLARVEALCRWLADEGHITPVATRQLTTVFVRRSTGEAT